ncbi:MAG: hypothetical protein H7837_11430 [Magnetococcus sp. MYC-9]
MSMFRIEGVDYPRKMLAGKQVTMANAVAVNALTTTEIGTLDGVTAPIQGQLDDMAHALDRVNSVADSSFVAGVTVGGERFVALTDDGTIVHADASNMDHALRLCGLTMHSGTAGEPVQVRRLGLVEYQGWSWDPGRPAIFLGSNGLLTQTMPTSGFSCVVGHCESPTKLFIQIQPAVVLASATTPSSNPDSPGGSDHQVVLQAGQALESHRAVLLDSAGCAVYADSRDVSHAGRLLGVTTHAATADGLVTVHVIGEMLESSWSWEITRPVFLGPNGQLTQVPPSTGFMQVIGQPVTAHALFLNPKISITLCRRALGRNWAPWWRPKHWPPVILSTCSTPPG